MENLFDINGLISSYGYIGIGLIVFLESGIFFALPGDSLLFTVGLFSASGHLNLFIAIPLIFATTFLGALFGYYVGFHLNKLYRYTFFKKIVKEEHLQKTRIFFEKYGKLAIIFSRFVPIVRTFMPIIAGVVNMDFKSFVKYSLWGSLLWSTVVTLAGYFLGKTFPEITKYMPVVIILVVLLSLVPAALEVIRQKKKKD